GAVAHAETLHGRVVDKASREPVGGATIAIGGELAASADDGTFIVALPRGRYTLVVSADWLDTVELPVLLDHDRELRGGVSEKAAPAGETIEVTGIAPTAVGDIKVDAKLARSVPGGGDAAKIVQSLPAVARPSAGSTEIVVWGAAPRDTRVFVDGVPVPA